MCCSAPNNACENTMPISDNGHSKPKDGSSTLYGEGDRSWLCADSPNTLAEDVGQVTQTCIIISLPKGVGVSLAQAFFKGLPGLIQQL